MPSNTKFTSRFTYRRFHARTVSLNLHLILSTALTSPLLLPAVTDASTDIFTSATILLLIFFDDPITGNGRPLPDVSYRSHQICPLHIVTFLPHFQVSESICRLRAHHVFLTSRKLAALKSSAASLIYHLELPYQVRHAELSTLLEVAHYHVF